MFVDPMRYMTARDPRHEQAGDVVKCRDGTWVAAWNMIATIWVCVVLLPFDRGNASISLSLELQVNADQQMLPPKVLAYSARSLNGKYQISNINVKASSMVWCGCICSVEKKRWRSGPKPLLSSRR